MERLGRLAGVGPDDNRSQQMTIGGHIDLRRTWHGGQLSLTGAIDHSILTERGQLRDILQPTDPAAEGRLDMLTTTIGLQWQRADQQGDRWFTDTNLAAGISYRYLGEAQGEVLQNNWHQALNIQEVEGLAYTGTTEQIWGVWSSAGFTVGRRIDGSHVFERWGLWTNVVGHVAEAGMSECSLRTQLFIEGEWVGLWFGTRIEGRTGYDHDFVMETVDDHDDGVFITGGIRLTPWLLFETGKNLHTNARYGRIGISVHSGAGTIKRPARTPSTGRRPPA